MKINDKEYKVSFGLNQSIEYCKLRGISITEMNNEYKKLANGLGDGSEIRDLIWSSLKDGARKEKVDFELTNLDVGDLIENMSSEEMEKWILELKETLPDLRDKKKVIHKKK